MNEERKNLSDPWQKPIWDRDETAAALGVHVRTLDRLRRLHKAPPCVRVGNQLRWRRDSVLEWIAKREVAA